MREVDEPSATSVPQMASQPDVISDEVLRSRVRAILDDPVGPSWWKRLSTNPLSSVILGFALTGLVGALLTNHYASVQKDTELERAFAIELSKMRVEKIAEVWEKVYLYESLIDDLMESYDSLIRATPGPHEYGAVARQFVELRALPRTKNLEEMANTRSDELLETLNKNRFWIADDIHAQIREYVTVNEGWAFRMPRTELERDKNIELMQRIVRELTAGTLLKTVAAQREKCRASFAQIRSKLLKE